MQSVYNKESVEIGWENSQPDIVGPGGGPRTNPTRVHPYFGWGFGKKTTSSPFKFDAMLWVLFLKNNTVNGLVV